MLWRASDQNVNKVQLNFFGEELQFFWLMIITYVFLGAGIDVDAGQNS